MATPKKTQIVITANAAVAKKVMDELQQRIDQIKSKMAALDVTTKEGKKEFKKLEKELISYNSAVSQNITNTERIKKAMGNLSKTSLNELKRALSAAKSELGKMSASDPKLAEMRKNVEALQGQIDKVTGAAHKQGGAWNTALKNLTAYVGLFAAFNKAKQMITDVIKKNLDYSGSLTDIRKVAGLAKADIDELSKSLAKIDTRTTTEGLAQIAYQGAKLGMSKYGIEGMAEFVRAADQINVAIGEEMGEEALPALSKMVEVMGLIPKLGVERSLLSAGSALFKLSTTSTATSGNIVEFAKRLTGLSRTAGITTDQLFALGSASDSMMLMPEVASTAFSKLITSLQRSPGAIEKALQMPQGRINELFSAGNAMQAIVEILESMKSKGNMNALDNVFKDLGSDGARLISVMVTMSKNVDILKDHLDVANESFREGKAVTSEYKMQQESAIGIMERAQNLWEKAFINPGGVDNVKELAQTWYDVSRFLTENAVAMGSMNLVLNTLLLSAKSLVYILPALMAGLMFKGAASAITGIKLALVGMGEQAIIATLKTEGLNAAWKKLNASMKANWISVVIGLVVELGVVIYETFIKTEKLNDAYDSLNGYLEEAAASWDKEKRKIDSYIAALEDANTNTDQRRRIIKKFNSEYGAYLDKLGLEVTDVNSLKDAYVALNDEIKKKMYWQLREKAYEDKLGKVAGNVGNATMDYSKYINSDKGATWSAFDTKWLQEQVNAGKSSDAIYKNMVEAVYGKGGVWSGYNGEYLIGNSSVKDNLLRTYISNFVTAGANYNTTKKEIDDAFNPIIGDYDPFKGELPGTLDNVSDKEKKKAAQAQMKEWRQQLKEAQSDANAIIDKIKNYYERQILEVTEKSNELNLDEEQTDALIRPVRAKMNDALAVARKAISNVEQGWDTFKQTMQDDMIEVMGENGLNESQMLLEQIEKADLQALQEKIATLSKSLNRPESALMDQIWRNATKNAQANADADRKQREEIQKILLEHDYTGIVDNNATQQFEKIGAFSFDAAQVRTLLGGDTDASKALIDSRAEEIATLLANARQHILDIYEADVSSEEGRASFISMLLPDKTKETSELKAVFDLFGDDMKSFYLEIIKYTDEYTEAIKKADDERKKINAKRWAMNPETIAENKAFEGAEDVVKKQGIFGNLDSDGNGGWKSQGVGTGISQGLGFNTDWENDPEIMLDRMRLESKQRYFEEVSRLYALGKATEDEYQNAQKDLMQAQNDLTKKLAENIAEQTGNLLSFLSPLQAFGDSVGEAFATMHDDAAAGRKAINNALKEMTKSFAKATLGIIQQNLMRQLNNGLTNDSMLLQDSAYSSSKQTIAALMYANLLMQQAAYNGETITMEAALTKAKVALDSAQATAKGFAQLGPIGGPIAIALMMAIIGAALSYGLSMAFKGGDSSSKSSATTNTKLVSGMLTYDSGNVSSLADSSAFSPYVGTDGSIYYATQDKTTEHKGISLYDTPTATSINGQPSLVAERGPELVIGRETTRAMMQDNPSLLRALYQYDRHHSGRTLYDNGNLTEFGASNTSVTDASAGTNATIADSTATNIALTTAINTLLARLDQPIEATINMYGSNGLYERSKQAERFMRGK